jgi:propanol-preferring alcohol dehydrogenase
MDGSYAEYAVAWASHVVLVPDEVAPIDASPLTCAGVTTYKVLKAAPSQPGDTAMVVGVGGPGHLGPQCPVIRRDARVDLLLRWSDTAG